MSEAITKPNLPAVSTPEVRSEVAADYARDSFRAGTILTRMQPDMRATVALLTRGYGLDPLAGDINILGTEQKPTLYITRQAWMKRLTTDARYEGPVESRPMTPEELTVYGNGDEDEVGWFWACKMKGMQGVVRGWGTASPKNCMLQNVSRITDKRILLRMAEKRAQHDAAPQAVSFVLDPLMWQGVDANLRAKIEEASAHIAVALADDITDESNVDALARQRLHPPRESENAEVDRKARAVAAVRALKREDDPDATVREGKSLESAPPSAPEMGKDAAHRAEVARYCLEKAGGDLTKAGEILKDLTAFEGEDGEVCWCASAQALSGKWLNATLGKVRQLRRESEPAGEHPIQPRSPTRPSEPTDGPAMIEEDSLQKPVDISAQLEARLDGLGVDKDLDYRRAFVALAGGLAEALKIAKKMRNAKALADWMRFKQERLE